jgi:hypothetical protein
MYLRPCRDSQVLHSGLPRCAGDRLQDGDEEVASRHRAAVRPPPFYLKAFLTPPLSIYHDHLSMPAWWPENVAYTEDLGSDGEFPLFYDHPDQISGVLKDGRRPHTPANAHPAHRRP